MSTKKTHNVIIAESSFLLRKGLVAFINESENFNILSEISNYDVLELAMSELKPDILIMEHSIDISSSARIIKEIRLKYPETKLVILSNQTDSKEVKKLINSGITTYLFKDCNEQEISNALKYSILGNKFFCAKTKDILLEESISLALITDTDLVSIREKEIILLLASGKRPKEIADQLNISPNTVNTHKKNIYKKLGVNSSYELGKFALKNLISV